ncbi:MAG: hypothetical protein JW726_01480, partial [Anaerolineales bacterium]|nr:hypothetical protein [Anaerolineales bacterium]
TVEVGNVSAGTLTNLAEISTETNDPQSDNDQSDVDVTIQNTVPVLSTADQNTMEGTSYTVALGSFVDVADDTHTATVNWGDGSATEAATVDQGANTISGVHTYAEDGDYTVSVTVTDNKGGADTATFTMAVSNADPQATPAADQTALTGEAITLTLATFTDAGVEDTHTATVDWGDGSATEAATVDQDAGEVSGSHVYASEGTVTVTVTVEDDDGGSVAVTFEVVVTRSGYEVFLPFTRK